MIVIVEDRALVRDAYRTQFNREGYAAEGFTPVEFGAWLHAAHHDDLTAITGCLIAEDAFSYLSQTFPARSALQNRLNAPVLVLVERPSLENILSIFDSGAHDVLRKPMHVREIMARIGVIAARTLAAATNEDVCATERLQVYLDGRDPQIDGETLVLPRRERRILEYLASIGDRRATKAQIYNAIYGLFNENVEETVVESHMSKLRKKLRESLGYDPIDSKRFLGYRLMASAPEGEDMALDMIA